MIDGVYIITVAIVDAIQLALIAPFAEFAFMRRALVSTLAISLSAAPLGVFLTIRRMSLLGDALSHAVLPGVAIGYMLFGLSMTAMAVGGMLAGIAVAALAGIISRSTAIKEDASLSAMYLLALALGVTIVSKQGTQLDLLHILFGSALGVDTAGLYLVAGVTTISLLVMDPMFISASGKRVWLWQQTFLMLVVMNLVAGFQTLGTLMAVGLMMLPAVSARLWHNTLPSQLLNASFQAVLSGYAGLLLSYHLDTPSGPTIIASAGALYAGSLLMSPGGWLTRYTQTRHRIA
jgi:zinc/manganese transport system permease protein